jgi:inhibitor of cysteine peptidase
MSLIRTLLVPIGVALALLAGMAPWVSAATGDTITVGLAASGSSRHLGRGDLLVVRLSSNPSTGYSWTVRSGIRPVLALVSRAYVPPRAGQPLGAPGTAVLRFRAVAAGKTVLRLASVRSWESGGRPARTFTLHVTVS